MSLKQSLPALLGSLQQALISASESVEKIQCLIPPKDGISLLDSKNELFLSYLQNLVFLIIIKLRHHKGDIEEQDEGLEDAVVRKLVELQVYLEKGVRPLESKLKYQIDKVLRAADDAKRLEIATMAQKKATRGDDDADSSDENDEDDSDAEAEDSVGLKASEIDDLQYRPNPSSFVRPSNVEEVDFRRSGDGVYKPPRIQATSMPTTSGPREKEAKRPNKSATLDEFVNTEMSSAPFAEPSIGSTIVSGGRRSKSEKERKEEQERKEYEEKNYVRLPKETKKDRAKKGGRKDAGYGGEEWRGIGEGVDRIDRLTKRKDRPSNVVEKSRKRPTEDGPRGAGGAEFGQGMQKRLKTLDTGRRDRGRN